MASGVVAQGQEQPSLPPVEEEAQRPPSRGGSLHTFDELQDMWKPVLEDAQSDEKLKQTTTLRHKHEVPLPRLTPSSVQLPQLDVAEDGQSSASELALQRKLAEGGMGRLYVADQTSLRREVVVKMALPGENEAETSARLLQESWLTGLLEHPNIVPVYQLGKDRKGQPMLVMKRIEGVPWSDILSHQATPPAEPTNTNPSLDWHIRILIQVCNAMEFAHNKGIIHRDLKPENIMVGGFGEVYVLDWGIAVSCHESDKGRIPLVRETQGIAGTPAYMAPEMARGENHKLGYSTDIYLLGAILHEIITGSPPHRKNTLLESLFSIYRSEPQNYGELVPRPLVSICHRAMHADPSQRFADVSTFRLALQDFLHHRESLNLSTHARQVIPQIRSLLDNTQALDEQDLYSQFGRCHFGLQHALEIWADNEEALSALQELLELMFAYEMQQENVKAAGRWLAEMPTVREDLKQQWEALSQRLSHEKEHLHTLERLAFETDLRVGAHSRRLVILWIGAVWGITPLALHFVEVMGWYRADHLDFLWMHLGFGGVLLLATFFGRNHLLRNQVNRQIMKFLGLLVITFLVQRVVVLSMEIPFQQTAVLEMVIFFMFIGIFAILYDRRMYYPAALYLLALSSSIFWPTYLLVFLSVAHFFGTITLAWLWTTQGFQESEEAQHPLVVSQR